MESQTKKILAHLKSGKTITPLEALAEFGCLRLSGRIYDLRRDGHQIETNRITTKSGKTIAQYKLAG